MLPAWGWSATQGIPPILQEWVPWVLRNSPELACPIGENQGRQCSLLSKLHIEASATGARFELNATLYTPDWINLPGDPGTWPTNVQGPGPIPVVERAGRPAVYLQPGNYLLKGTIPWSTRPRTLAIPQNAAILSLSINGIQIKQPTLDENTRLWLGESAIKNSTTAGGDSHIRIYRRLIDEIPARLITRMFLDLTGADREILVDSLQASASILMRLQSQLPARFDPAGKLRIQASAGNWIIEFESRFTKPINEFRMTPHFSPLPGEEFWSFSSQPGLRGVTISGVPQVDAEQVQVPEDWRGDPCYRLTKEVKLALEEVHRGAANTDPSDLQLIRIIYPDFSGNGATIVDQLTGTIRQPMRLSSQKPLELGRLTLDGQPMVVTTVQEGERGLEMPAGQHILDAVSRLEGQASSLGSSNWNTEFERGEWTVQIPPGWWLIHASGSETSSGTWVSEWTLWAVFLVLLIAAATSKLLGLPMGFIAALGLTISYHLPGSPTWVLLNLLGALLLFKVLPAGKAITRWVARYAVMAGAVAALVLLLFSVQELRTVVYPQLDSSSEISEGSVDAVMFEDVSKMDLTASMEIASRSGGFNDKQETVSTPPVQDGIVQTGPGRPDWSWGQASLRWSSTILPNQNVSLIWGAPWLIRIFRLLALASFWILTIVIIKRFAPSPAREKLATWLPRGTGKASLLALILLVASPSSPQATELGAIPDSVMLGQLRELVSTPPACTPHCSELTQVTIEATGPQVTFRLVAEALAPSIMILPSGSWTLAQADCRGCTVGRNPAGNLVAALPHGRSEILLRAFPNGDVLDIAFPTVPRHLNVQTQGWSRPPDNGAQNNSSLRLQKVRAISAQAKQDSGNVGISPFLRVQRHLVLDRQWTVTTTVQRVAPIGTSVTAEIPLLPGEAVLSAIPTQGNHVRVTLSDERPSANWNSMLTIADSLALTAEKNTEWAEEWLVASTPRWQTNFQGPPRLEGDVPSWKPWPGETLVIHARAPHPVPGSTYTVENANLNVDIASQSLSCNLRLTVVSSQGGSLRVKLPEGARTDRLEENGTNLPLLKEADGAIRLPLHPGEQTLVLYWKQANPSWGFVRSPQVQIPGTLGDITVHMTTSEGFWTLALGGPALGPALLYWGMLLALILLALILRKIPSPIGLGSWILLFVGTCTINVFGGLPFALWIGLLAWRAKRNPEETSPQAWNLMQMGIAALGVISLALFLGVIPWGLLGSPEMDIQGNHSSAHDLNWYQDRMSEGFPQAWIFGVPLWVYRGAMLLWSLWLVWSLGKWLRWAWQCFSAGPLWKPTPKTIQHPDLPPPPPRI